MFEPDFRHQAETLDRARSALMAPHPLGEAHSFAVALRLSDEALRDVDLSTILDDRARSLVGRVQDAIETPGPKGQRQKGRWQVKAEQMSLGDRAAFSSAVDELAHWFAKECVRQNPGWLEILLASLVFDG
jgi:hypothetical protein